MAPKGKQTLWLRDNSSGSSYATYSRTDPVFSSSSDTGYSARYVAADRNIPVVVICRILSRLPVKSVLRFTCVSKQWRRLVSLPRFISHHLARSPASLLIHALQPPIPANGEIQPQQQPGGHAIYAYHGPPGERSTVNRILDFPGHDAVGFNRLDIIGSTPDGVFCIVQQPYARSFTLWNPATGSSLRIPRPDPRFLAAASGGFGFDPSRNEYKLIRILHFVQLGPVATPDVAEVFDFQTGSWVRLANGRNGTVRFRVMSGTCEAVVNGVPYWRAWDIDPVMGPMLVLAWFDARRSDFMSEVFGWETENRKMVLGEIREGYLGAIVWDVGPAEDGVFNVWLRSAVTLGRWAPLYRVDQMDMVARLDIVGLYALDGSSGIVQQIVDDENGISYLRNINTTGDNLAFEDYFSIHGSCCGISSPVLRFRESLARMPTIGFQHPVSVISSGYE